MYDTDATGASGSAIDSASAGDTGSAGAPSSADDRFHRYPQRAAEVDRLGDEIAMLSAQIQAATYELLSRLREFDKREGWGHHGAKSCAHWLAWRISLDPGAAREWVRVARALEYLPALSEAMRKGEVSYSKARALTRIATPETDASLVELAHAGTAEHIEKIVRACRRYGPKEELDQEKRRHDSRYVHVSRDEDGMFILRARLDAVAGAVVARALAAADEALYQTRRALSAAPAKTGSQRDPREADQSAASKPALRENPGDEMRPGQRRADALVLVAESALAGGLDPGTAGDRYQVVVHVDSPVLSDPAEQGVSCLADGQHVSAETSRRVACDAATVVMTHAPDGSILDVGRKTRTISPGLRRALSLRDGGCRFPGCGASRCDAHHVKHWADGGETSLDNTILLCRFHHRLLHEEAFQLKRLAGGEVEFRNPRGLLVPDAPAPPRAPIDPFAALLKQLEDGGIVVDPYTGTPLWDSSPPDLGVAVEWFLAKTASDEPSAGGTEGEGTTTGSGADTPIAREADSPRARADVVENLNDLDDAEDDEADWYEISPQRLAEIEAIVAEYRGPSALTYEFVTSEGVRIPFQEAVFRPEFQLEWSAD